jgi:uncharacterized membrane protein
MRDWRDGRLMVLALALAVTCLCGWLFKAHCTPGGWTGGEQYTTGCYSDAMPFWAGRNIDKGQIPYLQAHMEYPVLTGLQIWIEGGITHAIFGADARDFQFLGVVSAANALFAGLILWLFWQAGIDRRRLWAWAAAPPLILYLGHNWDLGAGTLAVAAMLLARSGRLVPAAATAALGAAAKLFPVLMLPLIGLGALFGEGDWRHRLLRAAACTGAAVLAWGAVNLPIALMAPGNWSEFYLFSQARPGTAASTWEVAATMGWWATTTAERNLYAVILFCTGAALIVALGWRRHRPHPWVLFTPMLAWFMLSNKVYSPQFDLWLYPVLLMTAPRLRPVALFVAADIVAYFAEFWFFAGAENAWPYATSIDIALAAGFRAAVMLVIIVDAVRHDPPEWIARRTG